MTAPSGDWRPVTKGWPCPACSKGDWCAWTRDGWLKCERATEAPVGMVRVSIKDNGALFRPEGDRRTSLTHRGKRKPTPSTPSKSSAPSTPSRKPISDLASIQKRLETNLTPALLRELAGHLGVTEASLVRIGAGWNGSVWTFPEFNATGLITGHSTRTRKGKKRCASGSTRGLLIPAGDDRTAPCLAPEGPSDVAASISMGLSAVGRPNASSCIDVLCEYTVGRQVLVVGENDEKEDGRWPGREGAIAAATALARCHSRPVSWTLPPQGHKDIRSWLNSQVAADEVKLDDPESLHAAGRRLTELLWSSATEIAPATGLVIRNLGDVEPLEVGWLWQHRLPAGMVVILAGDPDLGKSTIAIHIAATLTVGAPWADGSPGPEPGGVVWLSAEDDIARVLVPKLRAAGADMRRVSVLEAVRMDVGVERPFTLDADLEELDLHLDLNPDVKLVVVDPITAYLGKANQNSVQDLRPILSRMKLLCERRRITVLAISHFNKGVGGNPMYRVTGSLALAAGARTMWIVCEHPQDAARRLFLCAKMNIASKPQGLEYRLTGDPPMVKWHAEAITITAAEALSAADTKESAESDPCQKWLKARLQAGPVEANKIFADGAKAGFKPAKLRVASKRLHVRPEKQGFERGWVWALPVADPRPKVHEDAEDSEDSEGAEGESGAGGAP